MITGTDMSFLNMKLVLQHNWFSFKKSIYDISSFIGITWPKFNIIINQMYLLFFFITIWV